MKIRENILPVLKPHGGEEEIKLLKEVISSGWWGKGSKVEQLEKFAELVGINMLWQLQAIQLVKI